MIAITEDNKETFIAVVGWFLILIGAFGAYDSATRALLTLLFADKPIAFDFAHASFFIGGPINFAFSVAAIWCGIGVLKRRKKVLRIGAIVGWSYIFLVMGVSLSGIATGLLAFSSIDTTSPEVARAVREGVLVSLTYSVRVLLLAIFESALIVWALAKLFSESVREEFTNS